MTVTYRKATIDDAESLAVFLRKLECEATLLLFNPGERQIDTNQLRTYLQKLEHRRSLLLIAIDQQQIIRGYAFGEVSLLQRAQHVMKINIGVLKSYQHSKVTYRLTKMLHQCALERGITRGEATVIQGNSASLAICKKLGFVVEGIKKASIQIDGKYLDEVCLGFYCADLH